MEATDWDPTTERERNKYERTIIIINKSNSCQFDSDRCDNKKSEWSMVFNVANYIKIFST